MENVMFIDDIAHAHYQKNFRERANHHAKWILAFGSGLISKEEISKAILTYRFNKIAYKGE